MTDNYCVSASWQHTGQFTTRQMFPLDLVAEYHEPEQLQNNQNTQL